MSKKLIKPLILRACADRDVAEATDYYLTISAVACERFIDSLEKTFHHIRKHPSTGSPRYAHELSLPGLRFWRCTSYPHLVFYVELEYRVEIWRVLHGARDLPNWLQADEASHA